MRHTANSSIDTSKILPLMANSTEVSIYVRLSNIFLKNRETITPSLLKKSHRNSLKARKDRKNLSKLN